MLGNFCWKHLIFVLYFLTVPAAWGTWSSFGACSASCGVGTQTRDRICEPNKECPNCEDGKCYCNGDPTETVECNEQCCERKSLQLNTSYCRSFCLIVRPKDMQNLLKYK